MKHSHLKYSIIIDILLLLTGLIACIISIKPFTNINYIGIHCIIGLIWLLLMIIHAWQHWYFIRLFTKRKIILNNKITFLTIIVFISMFFSILFFMFGNTEIVLNNHNIIGKLFGLIITIHIITKTKRFVSLFRI